MIGSISITPTTPSFFMLDLNLLLPVQLVIVFDVPSPSPLQSALIHLFGSRDTEVQILRLEAVDLSVQWIERCHVHRKSAKATLSGHPQRLSSRSFFCSPVRSL